ncbi:TorD/DmsD family molecular chaperone [Sedimenticola hydrogenitrophicus]|uniref:TorD/DmsD family molecular chaperone n=1 Tax=Sedimenticola hydrogenitrophicus TaxID=2967975 RepID=UPI0021A3B6FC|nr:molecular chaperone TorD family protein [Sedimenticola hydrogenitrophicus]
MIDYTTMADVAAERGRRYAVLATLYSAPPSAELLESLQAEPLLMESGNAAAEMATEEMIAFLEEMSSSENIENELTAEYTRLFVLPSGVHPHESFYLDEKQRVGGRISVRVQAAYHNAGVQLTKDCLELPDHIGVELESLNFLCGIEEQLWRAENIDGLRQNIKHQSDFLAGHLLLWYQPFCARVIQESKSGLYRALAYLTLDLLQTEGEFVPGLFEQLETEGRVSCEC